MYTAAEITKDTFKMVRVGVNGAAGRMGKTLIQASVEHSDTQLSAAFEIASSNTLGNDAGVNAGIDALGVEDQK